jgi:hypothetical protein
LPNFIGIGAPKAGTTWLARCLGDHPQVFMAAAKETSYFRFGNWTERRGEYEEHFRGGERAVALGEFSTDYFAAEVAPARIKATIPDARLLLSLRNPIEQVYSHYWHLARQNFHSWSANSQTCTFEQALETYGERLLAPGRYFEHLTRWLEQFRRDQLLVVFYDDISARPADVLREVYGFLGVDTAFVPPSTNATGAAVRRGVSPRSSGLGRLHAVVYDRLNRCVYRPLKGLLGVRRAARLKDLCHVRQVMERVFFRTGYPPMRPDTRALLGKRFAAEIRGIEDLTGRDLGHWK